MSYTETKQEDGRTFSKVEGRDVAALELGVVQHLREVVNTLPHSTGLLLTNTTRRALKGALEEYYKRCVVLLSGPDAESQGLENIRLRAELKGRIDEIDALRNEKPAQAQGNRSDRVGTILPENE